MIVIVNIVTSDKLQLACCVGARGVAKELLETEDSGLEANARKIKHMCNHELIYVAAEGKFNLEATPQGSLLWSLMETCGTGTPSLSSPSTAWFA